TFLLLSSPTESDQQELFYALFLTISLFFSDLCFSSVTIPKLLQNMQSPVPSIFYAGCLTQMYFFLLFADIESFLLVATAYDHYVAICFPLHYTSIMSPKLCLLLVALSWPSLLHTLLMAGLYFCADNVIPYFFCDMSALLKLINEMVIFILGGLVIIVPFLFIFSSYARTVSAVLKVPSARSIRKAFSTCGFHRPMVSLFYGTIIGLYLCPSANISTVKETVMAVMYMVVTPVLNPFIYSLRNQDMKGAMGRVFSK
uniref:G-protein coupled receptors family 1 profile domain-containing protein n=1 Tax=Chinchilla lanigera TaxID=34839 RepID=A0A8C2V9N7_CHILA